jgi:uncharacterized protein involved in type VI secretion and phage assembly
MRQFSGVYPAVVIDNVDPANSGRVQVRLPQLSGAGEESHEAWARVATLMAGNNRGTWFMPDVNDEVLVAFEGGDVRLPYVIGALWSGTHSPPETMDTDNTKKLLRSRSGVKITLDDQSGQQSFIVTINASAVEINSSVFSVNAALSKFSGPVQCDTLLSNSVVSASYTSGAGNVR